MLVPEDCIQSIGKTEITAALRTGDTAVMKASVERLKAFWTERFKKAREPSSPVPAKNSATPPDEDGEAFRQKLLELREKNLPRLLKAESDKELRDRLCLLGAGLERECQPDDPGGSSPKEARCRG